MDCGLEVWSLSCQNAQHSGNFRIRRDTVFREAAILHEATLTVQATMLTCPKYTKWPEEIQPVLHWDVLIVSPGTKLQAKYKIAQDSLTSPTLVFCSLCSQPDRCLEVQRTFSAIITAHI